MSLRTLLLVTGLIFTANNFADSYATPQLEQLSWLSGCWIGTGLGGEVEDCWMQAAGEPRYAQRR